MRNQKGLPVTPSQASPLAKQGEAAGASGLRGGRGQSLLEILLAFSVSILVLSAVVLGISTSLSNAQYTKNQGLANSYAQEGMAVVRQIRDSSRSDFSSKIAVNYCIGQNPTALTDRISTSCEQNVGIFSREATLEHNSLECCSNNDAGCAGGLKGSKVTVRVSWSDNKCPVGGGNPRCHDVELITCFSNVD